MHEVTDKLIKSKFPINGWTATDIWIQQPDQDEIQEIQIHIAKEGHPESHIRISVPLPVDWVGNTPMFLDNEYLRVLVPLAIPTPKFERTRDVRDLHVVSPWDMYSRALSKDIADALERHERKEDKYEELSGISRHVNELLSGECGRRAYAHKTADVESAAASIILDLGNSTRWRDYKLKGWVGILDITTTHNGDKAGVCYRLADGARIQNNRLVQGVSIFSKIMERCLVFPENDKPTRIMITRPTFAQHETLVYGEHPLVVHEEYDGDLSGKHLVTGILSHPQAYQDCIVISESAARTLDCTVVKNISYTFAIEPEVHISTGDYIHSGTVLLTSSDTTILGRHIKLPRTNWLVQGIATTQVTVAGLVAYKTKITLSGTYAIKDGSKLTNRHGGKGVVWIEEDSRMPSLNGVPLDVIVHPMSFNSRQNLGTFREMMVNRAFWKEYMGVPILRVKHFSDAFSMLSMVEQGYGEASMLDDGQRCFAAPLFWIRANKHPEEMQRLAAQDTETVSGKRLTMNYQTILHALGLQYTCADMLRESISRETRDNVKIHLEALQHGVK